MGNSNKVICPYCGQDYVWSIAISSEQADEFPHGFCFECDTFWDDTDQINDKIGMNFESYMTQKGEKPDWSKIQKGGEVFV